MVRATEIAVIRLSWVVEKIRPFLVSTRGRCFYVDVHSTRISVCRLREGRRFFESVSRCFISKPSRSEKLTFSDFVRKDFSPVSSMDWVLSDHSPNQFHNFW